MRPTNNAAADAVVGIWRILLAATVILALYFAQDILIPMALATLLAFVLAPLVTRMERWTGRLMAVLVVVVILCALVGGTGWVLTRQLVDVGAKLPNYRVNIEAKIRAFQLPGGGAASRLMQLFKELKSAGPGTTPDAEHAQPDVKPPPNKPAAPLPVEIVRTPESGPGQWVQKAILFFIGPLGKAALVLLLLIFILMQREDLLGRAIRLIGHGNISSTTIALSDAGERLARYLRLQLLVNITYGICVAIGLYFIGIPNALLWGGLSGILRFIPYVGPWLGAAPPIALALAISPNWLSPVLAFSYFVLLELINSNAVEPWLYGAVTGMTPMAIIAGAIFWTWIWGPIGLLLTTPLMLCLVVMGRHAPQLGFLTVLLSDQRALTPQEECYHRLLANVPDEAGAFADTYLETHPVAALYNDVLLPILTIAEVDYRRRLIYQEQRDSIFKGIRELIKDVRDHVPPEGETKEPAPPNDAIRLIYCLPARTERDELAGMMLAQLLDREDFAATAVSSRVPGEKLMTSLAGNKPNAVCVSAVMPTSLIQARHLVAKIRLRFPAAGIVVGLWGGTENDVEQAQSLRASGANDIVHSFTQAIEILRSLRDGQRGIR